MAQSVSSDPYLALNGSTTATEDPYLALNNPSEAAPFKGFARGSLLGAAAVPKGLAVAAYGAVPFDPETGLVEPSVREEYKRQQLLSPAQKLKEIQASPLYQGASEFQKGVEAAYPLSDAEKRSKLTKAGEFVGGFMPLAGSGPLAPLTITMQTIGDETERIFEEQKAAGKSEDEAAKFAIDRALASGVAQGTIFAALPAPLRKLAGKFIATPGAGLLGRVGADAAEGAVLGGSATAASNVAAERPLTTDVGSSAGALALVQAVLGRFKSTGRVDAKEVQAARDAMDATSASEPKTDEWWAAKKQLDDLPIQTQINEAVGVTKLPASEGGAPTAQSSALASQSNAEAAFGGEAPLSRIQKADERAAQHAQGQAEVIQQNIVGRQAGAPEETTFTGEVARDQPTLLDTRVGESGAQRERARLAAQGGALLAVDEGGIPPNAELSRQAQDVAAAEGEALPLAKSKKRSAPLKALADLPPIEEKPVVEPSAVAAEVAAPLAEKPTTPPGSAAADQPAPISPRPQRNALAETAPGIFPDKGTLADQFGTGSESGRIWIPNIPEIASAIGRKLHVERERLAKLIESRPIRSLMTYSRDSADQLSDQHSREEWTTVEHELNRRVDKNDRETAENALSFVVESGKDPTQLDVMRNKIDASTVASSKWKRLGLEAIDFAKANWAKLRPVADLYDSGMDKQWAQESVAGHNTPYRKRYVFHAQDLEQPNALPFLLTSGGGDTNTAFKRQRTHETFADSIAAGIDPKSLNALDLLQARVNAGQRNITRGIWVDSLRSITDPTNNAPIVTSLIQTTHPQTGAVERHAPDGYETVHAGNQSIAVQKDYAPLFRDLTEASWFKNGGIMGAVMKGNATAKSALLALDSFHLARVALQAANLKSPLTGPTKFDPNLLGFRQGRMLLDTSEAELRKMDANGELPPGTTLSDALAQKAKLDLAIKTGTNFGRISDALHQEWVRAIPWLGDFNKFLFDSFQRGAMAEVWSLEFDRQKSMFKNLSDEQVARNVSQDINTRFGNLGRQGIFTSRTGQDLARLILLAPQWNEGLVRSELGAITGALKSAKVLATEGRFEMGALPRAVGGMALGTFLANQVINYLTRGKPTWENEEEGIWPKISAFIPDFIGGGPGFFLNPFGLAAEISHLFAKAYGNTAHPDTSKGKIGAAIVAGGDVLKSRASALSGLALSGLTQEDSFGRKQRVQDVPGMLLARATTGNLPLQGGPFVAGGEQLYNRMKGNPDSTQKFQGQFQKQLIASFLGQKLDQAPSEQQRMTKLATDFNLKKGVERDASYFTGDFQPLSHAIELNNSKDAQTALSSLMEKKPAAQIVQHYLRAFDFPYTGNAHREFEFYQTLTPGQKDVYLRGVINRMAIAKKAIEMVAPHADNAPPVLDSDTAETKLRARLAVYDLMALPEGAQRDAVISRIQTTPKLAAAADEAVDSLNRWTVKSDQNLGAIPAKDGARARYVANEILRIPVGAERDNYLSRLEKDPAITPDVEDQISEIVNAGQRR